MFSSCCTGLFHPKQSGLEFCYAKATDKDALARVATQSYEEAYYPTKCNPVWKNSILASLNDQSCSILLVKLNNRIIGFAKVVFDERNGDVACAFLDKFYLLKAYHRRGFGSQLMKRCMEEVANRGANSIELLVWDKNDGAIEFYKRSGFVQGERRLHYDAGGNAVVGIYDYLMRCDNLAQRAKLSFHALAH